MEGAQWLIAGRSSEITGQAHNPGVASSNLASVTKTTKGPRNPRDCWGLVHVKPACTNRQCRSFVLTRPFLSQKDPESKDPEKAPEMSHSYRLDDAVRHRSQGPQGRAQVEEPKVYTIVRCLPIEADGRLRYRIKCDTIERVVTEDELSYCQ